MTLLQNHNIIQPVLLYSTDTADSSFGTFSVRASSPFFFFLIVVEYYNIF